jgi:Fe-S-cluster containining protein
LAANNECTIYDDRPKACREFPHTDRPKQAQILELTERNAEVCPAVVHIAEKLETVYRRLDPPAR